MTTPFGLDREQLEGLFAVLNHPQHQQGIEDRTLTVAEVRERARHLIRITGIMSGDDALEDWVLPNPTVRISVPETPEEFATFPGAPATTSRVYTLAEIDPHTRTVHIDIVKHGESSPAMRWLHALQVGDQVGVVGPRPHRVPGEGNPRILLADSSALPAASRILRTMPFEGESLLVAAVPEDEFALLEDDLAEVQGTLQLRRVEPEGDRPLADAFATLEVPATASVWASGERDDIREIRRRCKHELGLPPERMQVFGYWKRGTTNTVLDVARLRATQEAMASGGEFVDIDDFEIGL
ncbi:MAG: siderophore-interacting protein [Microbacteriaceae bacterium]